MADSYTFSVGELFYYYRSLVTSNNKTNNSESSSYEEQLYEDGKKLMPALADLIIEQYNLSSDIDEATSNRVIGATFMFLALVAAINPETISSNGKEPKALSGSTDPQTKPWPSFGKLSPLRD